ncbi:MAG TPA: FliH/SctL family protein [Chloroflexota bacterium]|jgi:flagellar assembly protein FliH
MPLPRVIRNATYLSEGVLIGPPEPEPAGPVWRMAPPPPPPPVEEEAELDVFGRGGDDGWSSHWGAGSESDQSGPAPWGEHDLEQRLADAERTLADARAETERLLEEARRTAAETAAAAEETAHQEIDQARAAALETLEQATVEAEQIRAEAQQRAREQGQAEGLAAGRAEGLAIGRAEALERVLAEMGEQIAHVTRLAESASVDRRELLHNAEAEVVRLAVQIAQRVLGRELYIDRAIVNQIAEAALQYVAVDGLVRLRVNPEDYRQFEQYWTDRHGRREAERSYEIVADPEVGAGGVVIDTRAGVVDARIETQLDEIARAIGALPDQATIAE